MNKKVFLLTVGCSAIAIVGLAIAICAGAKKHSLTSGMGKSF